MAKPIPYPPNRTARYGLWISLGFWAELVIVGMGTAEEILPAAVAFILLISTIAVGIGFCVVGYKKPPHGTAVAGLLVSAVNLCALLLIVMAAGTASGLTRFR